MRSSCASFALVCVLHGVLVGATLQILGPNICHEEERFIATVRKPYKKPVRVREYKWCLQVPPRCEEYKTEYVDEYRLEEEQRVRYVPKCCKGFYEDPVTGICVSSDCNECLNGVCSAVNGECVCHDGYIGQFCSEKCQNGNWGPNCSRKCGCKNDATCNTADGSCQCELGWIGSSCELKCPAGKYGKACRHDCVCPYDSICDHRTGVCFQIQTAPPQETSNVDTFDNSSGINNIDSAITTPIQSSTEKLLYTSNNFVNIRILSDKNTQNFESRPMQSFHMQKSAGNPTQRIYVLNSDQTTLSTAMPRIYSTVGAFSTAELSSVSSSIDYTIPRSEELDQRVTEDGVDENGDDSETLTTFDPTMPSIMLTTGEYEDEKISSVSDAIEKYSDVTSTISQSSDSSPSEMEWSTPRNATSTDDDITNQLIRSGINDINVQATSVYTDESSEATRIEQGTETTRRTTELSARQNELQVDVNKIPLETDYRMDPSTSALTDISPTSTVWTQSPIFEIVSTNSESLDTSVSDPSTIPVTDIMTVSLGNILVTNPSRKPKLASPAKKNATIWRKTINREYVKENPVKSVFTSKSSPASIEDEDPDRFSHVMKIPPVSNATERGEKEAAAGGKLDHRHVIEDENVLKDLERNNELIRRVHQAILNEKLLVHPKQLSDGDEDAILYHQGVQAAHYHAGIVTVLGIALGVFLAIILAVAILYWTDTTRKLLKGGNVLNRHQSDVNKKESGQPTVHYIARGSFTPCPDTVTILNPIFNAEHEAATLAQYTPTTDNHINKIVTDALRVAYERTYDHPASYSRNSTFSHTAARTDPVYDEIPAWRQPIQVKPQAENMCFHVPPAPPVPGPDRPVTVIDCDDICTTQL